MVSLIWAGLCVVFLVIHHRKVASYRTRLAAAKAEKEAHGKAK